MIPSLTFLLLLWTQFFLFLAPTWSRSAYYEYGWLVPPLALLLAIRNLKAHWPAQPPEAENQETKNDARRTTHEEPVTTTIVVTTTLLLIFLFRILEEFDPGWRVPMWPHFLLIGAVTHFIIAARFGKRVSLRLLGVTVLAMTAVPLPTWVEINVVQKLTGVVIEVAEFLCWWIGIPVAVQGSYLILEGKWVEVAAGCSGIRSLQTMVMWVFFLGELLALAWSSRPVLLVVGLAIAIIANAGRAVSLAYLAFEKGDRAFQQWHDGVGYLAFLLAAASTLLIAVKMRR